MNSLHLLYPNEKDIIVHGIQTRYIDKQEASLIVITKTLDIGLGYISVRVLADHA